MKPINRPEVMVGLAEEKFDAEGNLTDEKTKRKIGELIEALAAWTVKIKD